jgi:hypothetical protein
MLFRGQDTSLLVLGFYSPLTSLQLEDSMSECRTNILPRFVERGRPSEVPQLLVAVTKRVLLVRSDLDLTYSYREHDYRESCAVQ